jgi:hypothetical protein
VSVTEPSGAVDSVKAKQTEGRGVAISHKSPPSPSSLVGLAENWLTSQEGLCSMKYTKKLKINTVERATARCSDSPLLALFAPLLLRARTQADFLQSFRGIQVDEHAQ